jgi:hypothetical protein
MAHQVQAYFRNSVVLLILFQAGYVTARFARQRQTGKTDIKHCSAGDLPAEKVSAPAVQNFYRRQAMSTFYPANVGRIKLLNVTLWSVFMSSEAGG